MAPGDNGAIPGGVHASGPAPVDPRVLTLCFHGDAELCCGRVPARVGGRALDQSAADLEAAARSRLTVHRNDAVNLVARGELVLDRHALRSDSLQPRASAGSRSGRGSSSRTSRSSRTDGTHSTTSQRRSAPAWSSRGSTTTWGSPLPLGLEHMCSEALGVSTRLPRWHSAVSSLRCERGTHGERLRAED